MGVAGGKVPCKAAVAEFLFLIDSYRCAQPLRRAGEEAADVIALCRAAAFNSDAGERDAQGAVLRGYENAAVEDPARLFKLRLQLAAAVEAGAGGAGLIQRRGGLACCKRFCADTF